MMIEQAVYDMTPNYAAETCDMRITVVDDVPPVALHEHEDNPYGNGQSQQAKAILRTQKKKTRLPPPRKRSRLLNLEKMKKEIRRTSASDPALYPWTCSKNVPSFVQRDRSGL